MRLKPLGDRMRPFFILLIFLLSLPAYLFAEGHDQVTFAGQVNSKTYPYGKMAGLDGVSAHYGARLDYLHELSPDLWIGGGYTRSRGAFKNTEANSEFLDFVGEQFFGNRNKLTQKGPVWDKTYFKVGSRAGLYRWLVQQKQTGLLTELNNGPTYYSFGWSIAPYVAVGLGELGCIEYTQRMHFSGGADTSGLNNTYLSYVYGISF